MPIPDPSGIREAPPTDQQTAMWLLETFGGPNAAYHLSHAVELHGPVDARAMRRALDALVERHPALRTTFPTDDGLPIQRVAPAGAIALETLDAMPDDALPASMQDFVDRPFDLESGPLLRARLHRYATDRSLLHLVVHHIVSDGASMSVLVRDLSGLYAAALDGRDGPPPLAMDSLDWCDAHRRRCDAAIADGDLRWWTERLAGLAPLPLPTDRPRDARGASPGTRLAFAIDAPLAARLRALGREQGVTPFALMLAAFKTALHRWTGATDVAVGVPVAMRDAPGAEHLVGCLLETVVVRSTPGASRRFDAYLREVWSASLDAHAHASVPFMKVVEALSPKRRAPGANPVFQAMLSMQASPPAVLALPGVRARPVRSFASASALDLTLYVNASAHGYDCDLEYRTDLFDASTIAGFARRLEGVLRAVVADVAVPLGEAGPRTAPRDDAARAALRRPDGFVPLPRSTLDAPLHARIELRARIDPDAPAIAFDGRTIGYAALNARANRLARQLRAAAPDGPRPVALLLEQGASLVEWIVAILKADLAYAPLDARLPDDVLASMLAALGPRAVVAASAHRARAERIAGPRVVVLDELPGDAALADLDERDLGLAVSPDAIAYVFYTSGSTGAPKGVADSHRNVAHNAMRYANSLGFAPGDRMSIVQSPSFSGTVSTLFGALLTGATCVPYDARSPRAAPVARWVRDERITVLHSVPSIFRQLAPDPDRYPHLRLVRLEGDRADASDLALARDRLSPGCVVVNGLGATECGLVRQWFARVSSDAGDGPPAQGPLPIGYGVPDMALRVVDESGADVTDGAVGEIVVESRYLAVGYWGDAVATAQRFEPLGDGLRRYRTGDLGRLDAGCLTHLGRRDLQPRVAGRFVDTVALEQLLQALPGVARAIAHGYRDAAGDERIGAWIVPAPGFAAPSLDDVRRCVADRVPAEAVPTAVVTLDAVPLSADGKVDRRALPAPVRTRSAGSVTSAPPRSDAEREMATLWARVLELASVGVEDSFVALGGDSLHAARLVAMLVASARPGWREARTIDVFEHSTVRGLTACLEGRGGSDLVGAGWRRAAASSPSISSPSPDAALDDLPAHAIAIVGLAVRVPGSADLAAFWDALWSGRESITRRAGARGGGPPGGSDHTSTDAGAVDADGPVIDARGRLDDVEAFDAAFFGLAPRQAAALDPQQRVWLECACHALEDAGLDWTDGDGARTAVFAGGRDSTWLWDRLGGDRDAVDDLLRENSDDARLLRIANDTDSIATRASWLLDLRGPSVNVQSACSTSLVAIAQACAALAARQCDSALAGGVTVTFPRERSYLAAAGGIRSPDGRCRAFDRDANGTVFGDGVGAVVLKRLDDALRDGDRIRAVVRGWAVNNDGAGKASFAAPSPAGQAAVIAAAHAHADVDPRRIGYVEAHGTATPIGDPIEVEGLTRAFRLHTADTCFCAIGSVKTNVGHLDCAAGVVGFAKAVLALGHRRIPPTLNFTTPNPAIDFASSPFFVADRAMEWSGEPGARIAGVSSFGVGGTNCHVVLQEAPPAAVQGARDATPASARDAGPRWLALSARSPTALASLARDWSAFLGSGVRGAIPHHGGIARDPWQAIVDAAARGRGGHPHRLSVAAHDAPTAAALLDDFARLAADGAAPPMLRASSGVLRHGATSASPRIGFVFAGQGTQFPGMALRLYDTMPAFRDAMDRCDRIVGTRLGRGLVEWLREPASDDDTRSIDDTDIGQPLLFSIGWSLAQQLQALGVRPAALAGHSLGEYVAACVAGVLSLEDALAAVVARGHAMQRTDATGRMHAMFAAADRIEPALRDARGAVSIAALNGPHSTVIAGAGVALARVVERLRADGIDGVALRSTRAFHSPTMTPALDALRDTMASIPLNAPALPLFGGVYGRALGADATDAAYWVAHAREPVRFEACLRSMHEAGCEVFVEIGPQASLASLIADAVPDRADHVVPLLRRGVDDADALLDALARLHAAGVPIDARALRRSPPDSTLVLPPYPFERRVPIATVPARSAFDRAPHREDERARDIATDPLLGRRLRLPGSHEIRFESTWTDRAPLALADHRLFGVPIVPGASHFAMLAQAASTLAPGRTVVYRHLFLLRPLTFPDGAPRHVQWIAEPVADGWSVRLVSAATRADTDDWTVHLTADAAIGDAADCGPTDDRAAADLADVERTGDVIAGTDFYETIWANQGGTGRSFRWIERIARRGDAAACRIARPPEAPTLPGCRVHPGAIEAACQLLHACTRIETVDDLEHGGVTFVPFSVGRLIVPAAAATTLAAWCSARPREAPADMAAGDLSVFDARGAMLLRIEDFRLRRIRRDTLAAASSSTVTPSSVTPPERARSIAPIRPSTFDPADPLRYVIDRLADVTGHPPDALRADRSPVALGLDSVMAVMLSNRFRRDLGASVDVPAILASSSIESLARALAARVAAA